MTTQGPPGLVRVPSPGSQALEFVTGPEGLLAPGAEQSGEQSLETHLPGCGGRVVWPGDLLPVQCRTSSAGSHYCGSPCQAPRRALLFQPSFPALLLRLVWAITITSLS